VKWLRATLDGAGLAQKPVSAALATLFLVCLLVGLFAYELTSIFALAVSVAIGTLGLLLEILNSRAKSRQEYLAALWPEVLDSVISSISAGASVADSVMALAEEGPTALRPAFVVFRDGIERGQTLDSALVALKAAFANVHSDRLFELLKLVSEAGGGGLLDSLRNQTQLIRQELSFSGEIASKLGWITGTAKIAVSAPWLIVAMLATRPENARAYASAEGSMILFLGLVVSIFAFRLVQILGELSVSPRVFS
jgi:tight adherence protein B